MAITVEAGDDLALGGCVVTTNEDDFGCMCPLVDFISSLKGVHFRQDDVEHNHIRAKLGDSLKRYLPVLHLADLPILLSQKRTQSVQDLKVVVYNKNRSGCWHTPDWGTVIGGRDPWLPDTE